MKTPSRTWFSFVAFACLAASTLVGVPPAGAVQAQSVIPPTWAILADDFEGGSLAKWQTTSLADSAIVTGAGVGGSNALVVPADKDAHTIYQTQVAKAVEGYLTFWLNPNGVSLPEPSPNWWPPSTSISVADVINSNKWWPPLVTLYLRKPAGHGYQGFLAYPKNEAGDVNYDWDHPFDLADGWSKVTIGYRIDQWVAAWVNDSLIYYAGSGVVDPDPYGDIVSLGKNRTSSSTPSGSILLDNVAFRVPRVDDLWVNASGGDDANDGLTSSSAFRTIQRAANIAGPGTTVHILPGVYRETVWPVLNGSETEPVRYVAENGPGTAVIRGSEASSSMAWTQLSSNRIGLRGGVDPTKIYWADLSSWKLTAAPRFVVALDGSGQPALRMPVAREPDWSVTTEWKTQEFWWAADGGSTPAACDPATNSDPNCDLPQRSMTQLTDRTSDTSPAGIEAGNLTTLGDLTGGTLWAIDTLQGHYLYKRTITAHDVSKGLITVDRKCEHDSNSGNPGLGWGSKYYVENKPQLLDAPGEWWYDPSTQRIYIWPPNPGSPAGQAIEIAKRDDGFSLRNRSYTTLDGLTVEIVNQDAVDQTNWSEYKSYHNTLRNMDIRYANYGLAIEQDVSDSEPAANITDGFTLEESRVSYTDSQGIRLIDWWDDSANPDRWVHAGVQNTTIRGNEFHHLGFRTEGDNGIGLSFTFASKLVFEDNYVHNVAHNGVQVSESVIQSSKEYGFDPSEIKTGELLFKDNLIERTCQLTTDCGELKFWGSPPNNHVFRDVLVTGNIFRDTYGWTYVSEKRRRYTGGSSSEVRGMGAFGLYVDHASGITAYRNISYNNAYTDYMIYGRWRDGAMIYVNNVAANSFYGMTLSGGQYDTHGAVNTVMLNNILVNNEGYGMYMSYNQGRTANTTIDHNLYYNNGWRPSSAGGMWKAGAWVLSVDGSWTPLQTLGEVRAASPWEDNAVEGDPAFWSYDQADHNMHDGSWPDFHLTTASAAIDRGATPLPAALVALLKKFNVQDEPWGSAFDIGRYEAGFRIQALPASASISAGGTAQYALQLDPADLPYDVALSAASDDPGLGLDLSAITLSTPGTVTLTAAHDGDPQTRWITITVTGTGGGFTRNTALKLLVNGKQSYMPVIGLNAAH